MDNYFYLIGKKFVTNNATICGEFDGVSEIAFMVTGLVRAGNRIDVCTSLDLVIPTYAFENAVARDEIVEIS